MDTKVKESVFTRLMNLVYIILAIFAVVLPGMTVVEAVDEGITNYTYKIRCTNGNYVVLQGSPTDRPWEAITRTKGKLTYEDDSSAKLYCGYYDEARNHILSYRNARTETERVNANLAFIKFENNVKAYTLKDNYSLVLVSQSTERFWSILRFSLGQILMYSVGVQILRLIYRYVVFGEFRLMSIINKYIHKGENI